MRTITTKLGHLLHGGLEPASCNYHRTRDSGTPNLCPVRSRKKGIKHFLSEAEFAGFYQRIVEIYQCPETQFSASRVTIKKATLVPFWRPPKLI